MSRKPYIHSLLVGVAIAVLLLFVTIRFVSGQNDNEADGKYIKINSKSKGTNKETLKEQPHHDKHGNEPINTDAKTEKEKRLNLRNGLSDIESSSSEGSKLETNDKKKDGIVDVVLERNDHIVESEDFDGKPGNPVNEKKDDEYEEYYEVEVEDAEAYRKIDIDKDFDEKNPLHRKMFATRIYKEKFAKFRLTQLEATKSIVNFGTYEKRYQLLERMLNQMFIVFKDVKKNVSEWEIYPHDPLPDDAEQQQCVSKIFENVFLFGDLLFRLPDMVHDIFDRKQTWKHTFTWALHWCMDSKLFEGTSSLFLHLISQEVGLSQRNPNWVPDYSNMTTSEVELLKTFFERDIAAKQAKELVAKNKKKEKKKIKRGPRLSHTEL